MTNRKTIQQYVNNFRRRFSRLLKPGIGLSCRVLMAKADGAIIEITMGAGIANRDTYSRVFPTIADGLATIEQKAFGGNLNGFVFKGTNMVLEPNRMILLKDDTPPEWSDDAAERDVENIIHRGGGVKS